MEDSQRDAPNRCPNPTNVQQEASIYEDEINLIDYLLVLWKRKWFIFLASVLPTLVVGFAIFLGPRDYKISYTYNMGLGEKAFRVLEETFYSMENLEKLVGRLQATGFNEYAEKIAGAGTKEGLREFVSFESFEEQVSGNLLVMHVGAKSKENIREIALVCRENFEQVIPLYSEREQLNSKVINLKDTMGGIEEARYMLDLQLERKKTTLAKLKNSGSESLDRLPDGIVLQFSNVGGNSAYLPLPYQVQAAKTQIINLEEQIKANKEKHDYYAALLKLNEKLFGYVTKVMSSYYTLEGFHSFLTDTLSECNEQPALDYLKAYNKKIENRISTSVPVVKKPKIYPMAKGTVRKSATVFVVALMISVFAAFLLEGLQKSRTRTS